MEKKVTNMNITFNDPQLKEKLQGILEALPPDATKALVKTYYEIQGQECLNDSNYEDLVKLEWLVSLYNLLDQ